MELAFAQVYEEYQQAQGKKQEAILARWMLAKQTIWLSLLTAFFLMFYLIDILNQSMEILMHRY